MNYKEKPFYLDDVDIAWVENTLENMSLEEKITDAEECNRQLMKEMNQSQIKRRSIWE